MKINKILAIIIFLIMILNLLIPTVTLAVDSIEKKDNETTINADKNNTSDDDQYYSIDNKDNTADIEDNDIDNKDNTADIEDNDIDYKDNTADSKDNDADNKDNTTDIEDNYVDNTMDSKDNDMHIQKDNKSNDENINKEDNKVEKNTEIYANNTEKNIEDNTNKDLEEDLVKIQNDNIRKDLSVSYRTHVEGDGWQDYVQDGNTSGTSGRGLRLEAINIQLSNNTSENLNIKYQVHIEDIGWQDWKQNGEMAGTSGKSLRLEGIRIYLDSSEKYSIMYRVHVQDEGWQEWKTDGEMAGTSGKGLRLEAIEIKIVDKQYKGKLCIETPINGSTYYNSENSSINVSGWKIANVSNAYIKAYIDDKEIDSQLINYCERPDIISEIMEYGTNKQNTMPGYNFNIDISSMDSGNHTIKLNLCYESTILATMSTIVNIDKNIHVQYRTHVENEGWQDYVQDGEMSGTSGKGYRLEAMNIQLLNNTNKNLNIKYQVHVQDIGWQDWKQNGEMAGTSEKGLRLEAIRICIEGTEDYSIMYRVHIQNEGWQDWKTDGEMAGTSGKGLRLEAIEIKLIEKKIKSKICIETPTKENTYYKSETSNITVTGWKMADVSDTYIKAYVDSNQIDSTTIKYDKRPDVIKEISDYGTEEQNPMPGFSFNVDFSNLDNGNHTIKIELWYKNRILTTESRTFYFDTNIHIKYSAHVEEIGWQEYVEDGEIIGTIGRSLRVEALRIQLINVPSTVHIKYRSYVDGQGWTDYVQDGEQTGTTGQQKMIEAIQIELEGLNEYIIEYQAHVQNVGWQQWASNGMTAGTIEQGLRVEALKLRMVKKENTVVPQIKYSSHNSQNSWMSECENGEVSGNINSGLKLNAIKIALQNSQNANIKYQVHVQNDGWLDEVQNNSTAGSTIEENGIEAIKINLDGLNGYSIEYRVYIIGQGWQDWKKDGQLAGTTGESKQISAIQIQLNIQTRVSRSNFNSLDESKYPGYKTLLRKLQDQYPDWIITIKYTGLDWNTVIENEYGFSGSSPRSLTQYPYMNQWKSSEDNNTYDVSQNWYRASREAIAYMMDPRNSLEEAWIFQFQDLSSSAGTRTNIQKMVSGTFLNTESIIDAILSTAKEQGISPFHLISRILQEQGNDGRGVMNGYSYNGTTVYNLFNIKVSGNSSDGIIAGAQYAYENNWFTPEACIKGSAEFLKEKYISIGQSTLYFQKFNVVNNPLYNHQYMQNIRAANDEGNKIYQSYKQNGLLNSQFEFVIPVYEHMPSSACARPAT